MVATSRGVRAAGARLVNDVPVVRVLTDAGGGLDNGDTLTWSLADLPPGSQQSRFFSVQVNAAAALENYDLVMPGVVSSSARFPPSVAEAAPTSPISVM